MGPEQLAELLKETLDREEARNPPSPAGWAQIERRLSREPWRRALVAVAAASAVAVIALVAAPQLIRHDRPGPPRPALGTLALLSTTRLPSVGVSVAIGYGAAWIAGAGRTYEVDEATGRLLRRVVTPGTGQADCPSGVAAGSGAVWVTYGCQGVYKIDPRTSSITATISVPHVAAAIAVAYGLVWIATRNGDLMRLNPVTDAAAGAPIPVGYDALDNSRGTPPSIVGIVIGDGEVWADTSNGSVSRIDPGTSSVLSLPLGDVAAVGAGRAWVVSKSELEQVGLASFESATITGARPDTEPISMAVAIWRGKAWALSWAARPALALHVDEVDLAAGRVTGVTSLPGAARTGSSPGRVSITAGPTSLWVLEPSRGVLFRLGMPGR